ncbi:GNAT family N-acetyltransferase [Chthonobacter albigriseus]|uniref:GNAT family N-acetyltransferase n=1 Tax=Chthonobacter albigriseus TaxID=1683161 RepID=UPI0015EE80AF|nr:GNAT family N-acetyltransferase [Chthonobacter albigriseus]
MAAIRPARAVDLQAIEAIVREAYAIYVPRIGKEPAPMKADYAGLVETGRAAVLEDESGVAGVVTFWEKADHMYLDAVAVAESARGKGYGKALIEHVEAAARAAGLPEVRLYTNARMTENVAMYPRLGYRETHRAHDEGYDRVFYVKAV